MRDRTDTTDNSWLEGRIPGGRIASAVLTLVVVNCLLLLPTWIVHGGPGPQWVSLEAGLLVAGAALLPRRRWARGLLRGAGALVAVLFLFGIGDAAARLSLARSLNLYLDVQLISAVVNLLDGNLAPGAGVATVAALVLATIGLGWLVGALLITLPGRAAGLRPRIPAAAWVVVLVAAIPLRWLHPAGVVAGLPATLLVRQQTGITARMLGERARFGGEMAAAPSSWADEPGLLEGLGGRDVILAFVESYGISAVTDPRYAPTVRPSLDAMDRALREAGLHVATGIMEAPSQGGMSWLGHGSVLSGLWLENQLRYDLLLASDRGTLVDDFEAAGYRTAAVMPAITLAWPEGERFGYDEIRDFHRIPYAGPPLNWVTMPDQYTWSFTEKSVRRRDDPRPLFVEIGLISSHAPWTPILEVEEDWERVGDGSVFQRWRDAGETPEELWKDGDRVRSHYAMSVAYALDAATGYAANYLGNGQPDDALLILLGDHQPAPLITGEDAPRTVPVHVVARDPALLEPFRAWGFVDGTIPATVEAVETRRMDAFREWFVQAYSDPSARMAQ